MAKKESKVECAYEGPKAEENPYVAQMHVLELRIEELKVALEPFKFDGVLLSGMPGSSFNYQVPEVWVAKARKVW